MQVGCQIQCHVLASALGQHVLLHITSASPAADSCLTHLLLGLNDHYHMIIMMRLLSRMKPVSAPQHCDVDGNISPSHHGSRE
jgi:hypothetical protein